MIKALSGIEGVYKHNQIKIVGVYFLVKGRTVVYVGQSIDIDSRIKSHSDKSFDSVYILECKKSELDQIESKYILQMMPKYNKAIPGESRKKEKKIIICKYAINRGNPCRKDWCKKYTCPIKIEGMSVGELRLIHRKGFTIPKIYMP